MKTSNVLAHARATAGVSRLRVFRHCDATLAALVPVRSSHRCAARVLPTPAGMRTAMRTPNAARRQCQVHAAVAADAVAMEHAKTYKYGNDAFELRITVSELEGGSQRVSLATNHPSNNLILHWGVEGGANYRGGWRLPGQRPPNTVQYKERALQTSWSAAGDGTSTIEIALDGDEASDYINFVLKDAATGTWYDRNGSNFQMALRSSLRSFASIDDAESMDSLLSLDDIPEIPQGLAGVWAYIMWEHAGCPSRSQEDADREYQRGIAEMQQCLCRGKTLDELQAVADGKVKYSDFKRDFIDVLKEPRKTEAAPPPPKKKEERGTEGHVKVEKVVIPDDLIGLKAYFMWKEAGSPDGADFSAQARESIAAEMKQGSSLQEIEKRMRSSKREPSREDVARAAPAQQSVELGHDIGMPTRDPLKLIKTADVPRLSDEKKAQPVKPLDFLVQAAAMREETRFRRVYGIGDGAELLAVVSQRDSGEGGDAGAADVTVTLTTDSPNELVLHWGVSKVKDKSWSLPPKALVPASSEKHDGGIAVETPFVNCDDDSCDLDLLESRVPLQRVTLTVPPGTDVASLQFVLRSADGSMWYRDGSSNFNVPVPRPGAEEEEGVAVDDALVAAIIDAENSSAWTLMHRFNRAADLLGDVLSGTVDDAANATAALYVWLRYSAQRHLTWQRNYNTQPRILSAAQDRLTSTVARAHKQTGGEAQEWVRLMLSTVGRGGDGQRIRDEILNIMHRNHIPEKKGLWMEEWHQKLHNNTTPDDVPICEAYLAFLRAHGDVGAYWRVLSDAGITRARLESFDRAIHSEPQYYADKRDALIGEFQNYLGILNAVHSGADLQNAARNAGGCLPGPAKGHLGYVLASRGSNQVLPLIQSAVAARLELAPALAGNRDLLYLDLALEDVVRGAAERGAAALGMGSAAFVGPLLQNLVLTVGDNEELCYCLKAWQALPRSVQFGANPSKEEALQASAVVDRVRRGLSELSDAVVARVEPISTAIGKNCGVESWAVDLFAEEVVRGGPAFAVSLVLSAVEPALRRCADLGSWQIISPASVTGRVVVVDGLHEVEDKVYEEATILVARRVSGEEEVPEGAVAVLTPDAPDILSHVSVNARNMKVLFATCHEAGPLDDISSQAGQILAFQTTAAGGVTWETADSADLSAGADSRSSSSTKLKIDVPDWSGKWVVGMGDYEDGVTGAKSKNLAALRGKLPDWVRLPASVTLPFGCFEQVLEARENRDVRDRLLAAARRVPDGPAKHLAECREAVEELKVPREVRKALAAAMADAGIPVPENDERWAEAEAALIGVWASKFNDRAYFSMRRVGLNFMDLRMAVLVQRVVPAQYAFVIHTKNPSTGDADEIYCELVKGLGESLVSGSVPGSALAFVARKGALDEPRVVTYPSKSSGMFVRESLIFRSDSNGEDLAGYAGAGLYESITMDPTLLETVDYSGDPLMTDAVFRKDLMARICKVGAAIEESMGCAQDVEGVVDPEGNITVVQTRPQV